MEVQVVTADATGREEGENLLGSVVDRVDNRAQSRAVREYAERCARAAQSPLPLSTPLTCPASPRRARHNQPSAAEEVVARSNLHPLAHACASARVHCAH